MEITNENYYKIKDALHDFVQNEIEKYISEANGKSKLSSKLGKAQPYVTTILSRNNESKITKLEQLWEECRKEFDEDPLDDNKANVSTDGASKVKDYEETYEIRYLANEAKEEERIYREIIALAERVAEAFNSDPNDSERWIQGIRRIETLIGYKDMIIDLQKRTFVSTVMVMEFIKKYKREITNYTNKKNQYRSLRRTKRIHLRNLIKPYQN